MGGALVNEEHSKLLPTYTSGSTIDVVSGLYNRHDQKLCRPDPVFLREMSEHVKLNPARLAKARANVPVKSREYYLEKVVEPA
jgi:hypothetical protein